MALFRQYQVRELRYGWWARRRDRRQAKRRAREIFKYYHQHNTTRYIQQLDSECEVRLSRDNTNWSRAGVKSKQNAEALKYRLAQMKPKRDAESKALARLKQRHAVSKNFTTRAKLERQMQTVEAGLNGFNAAYEDAESQLAGEEEALAQLDNIHDKNAQAIRDFYEMRKRTYVDWLEKYGIKEMEKYGER